MQEKPELESGVGWGHGSTHRAGAQAEAPLCPPLERARGPRLRRRASAPILPPLFLRGDGREEL